MSKSLLQNVDLQLPNSFLRSRNLTLHKLNVFCKVAQLNSVTRAAEQLNIAQPAVTAHLRGLEESVGAQLVQKVGRNIELTHAGKRIYTWASEILHRSSEMFLDLVDINNGGLERTKIAASMVVGTYKLPDIILENHRSNPSHKVSVSVLTPYLATEAVLNGECDFGVTLINPNKDTSKLEIELLWREPLYLVAAIESDLVQDVAGLQELSSLPLVTPPRGQIARELIDEALRTVGLFRTNSVMAFGHPEPILKAIRADVGVGFVFESALPPDMNQYGLRFVKTPEISLSMPLYLVYNSQAVFTEAQKQLMERIRAAFARNSSAALQNPAEATSPSS
ncbi:HTH-type transcriptional activator CmpR [Labrenzia sp. THAF191b]|uniref:LysR family transcriptional regulator n=1 Tax=Stappiaceae TaxID=2821832 RepID=UPI0012687F0E|nr:MULTISPECIES: LysR family transcriptional regulator [Stappiaceae]MCR9283367.1 LysR family transcriptional regulator [Paracoccaceae bacterium]MBO9421621.1 LysR family transcriptional regulator [Labrenzia sp. R4_2]QFS97215.1 HTH-type transcriptional activator CmpR [Labrenzia sp. THAF191b]QFT03530.1 HTH-type transcriptional activator CmpR [Labrenzia sp. THAF191a]QFT15072.1 HTH-type transcriptional activator CmpR [Labrenzia sp. THAF187b]